MTARRLLLATLLLLAAALPATPAMAWWNGDWSYRMKINADAGPKGAAITDPIGRTQILLRLHSGNFNFATAKEDGSDLRFVAGDDRTPLHYHIEKYDGLIDQVGLVWIDEPDLAPGTTTSFFMYWGNKSANDAGDPHATYDADQLLVYHFADENGLPRDSTGYGNNALTPGKRDEGGMVGFGLKLDGSAPIRLPASPSLAVPAGQAMTWSVWARPNDDVDTGVIYQQRDGANLFTIGIDKGVAYVELDTGNGPQRSSPGALLEKAAWHLIAVIADAGKFTVLVDGQPRGELAAALPALAGQAVLGGNVPQAAPAAPPQAATPPATPTQAAPTPAPAGGAADRPPVSSSPAAATPAPPPAPPAAKPNFVGIIDEFQISKAARPLGAIQIAVKSQGPQANLLTFDVPEQSSVFGSGYIGIILRSVTPDAWVVIGVLGVLAVVSWMVMVGKAIYLSRIGSANRAFRAAFRGTVTMPDGIGAAPAVPGISAEKTPALRGSPLYRLYEVGMRELGDRIADGRMEPSGLLAPQSLAAIRSSVDGGLVREIQRLNRLMVLLTIAIAGGPFIGLLGTVIGVMITFAAIAAAGDVNVNAIAPGISAALLATVAGLAVAIPALFGYNYFITRIRDATSEMQVFVDELVTRFGEGVRVSRPLPGE